MPTEVIMPKVDMDMSEGAITTWHVQDGQRVERSAPLFDIETDKASMEIESPATGVLRLADGRTGVKVPIGRAVGWIFADGEPQGPLPALGAGEPVPVPLIGGRAAAATPPHAADAPQARNRPDKVRASPLAKRLARDAGIPLETVAGTAARGRVVRRDVEAAIAALEDAPGVAALPDAGKPDRAGRPVPLRGIRRDTALRMAASKRNAPHFHLRCRIRIDDLEGALRELNAALAPRRLEAGLPDLVAKACALALKAVPEANQIWAGDRILRMHNADIVLAVPSGGGRLTPVIRDAGSKSVAAIAMERRELEAAASSGRLKPENCGGGALAMADYRVGGARSAGAVLEPPRSSMLALGAIFEDPVPNGSGGLRIAKSMAAELGLDHRAIHGSTGARLLGSIKRNLEAPVCLLI